MPTFIGSPMEWENVGANWVHSRESIEDAAESGREIELSGHAQCQRSWQSSPEPQWRWAELVSRDGRPPPHQHSHPYLP